MKLRGNAAVAHGGGPTAVLNSSLAGICNGWTEYRKPDHLYGAIFGIRGLLDNDFVDLTSVSADHIRDAARAPGSMIGSSRQPLSDEDCESILRVFRQRDVGCFFYTGGNGSMETALRLSRTARERGEAL
jgi:6-phosphofructokinase